MSEADAHYARLQLRPDATEKDIRRAYAGELRKIDQAAQPQAFQELREAYDQLLWRVRQAAQQEQPQEQQAEPLPHDPAPVAQAPTAPQASAQPVDPAPAQPVRVETSTLVAEAERLARECLDELIARMDKGSFERHEDVHAFLVRCLDHDRLATVDARQYFEWGVAAILANGWRPGHELLFPSAMSVFGWESDRSRLLWLGRPGQIVDTAIGDLAVFDSQPAEHRAVQKEVIRALRRDERPKLGTLLGMLPVAEYAAATFPYWLHVISRAETITQWRKWDAAVPAWRRKLEQWMGPRQLKKRSLRKDNPMAYYFNWVFGGLIALGLLAVVLSPNTQPVQRVPLRVSAVGTPLWEAQQAVGRPPATNTPAWQPASPLVSPEMQAFKEKMYQESLQAARGGDPAQARRRAALVADGSPSPPRCGDASSLVREFPTQHQAGQLGGLFDALVLKCASRKLALFEPSAVQQSADREQRRAEQELIDMRNEARKSVPVIRGEPWTPKPEQTGSPYSLMTTPVPQKESYTGGASDLYRLRPSR